MKGQMTVEEIIADVERRGLNPPQAPLQDLGGDYCECCDPDEKWCRNRRTEADHG